MSVFKKLKEECEWAIKQIEEGKTVSVPETKSFFTHVLYTLERVERLKDNLNAVLDERGSEDDG